MPKVPATITVNPNLVALKPRQVLLLKPDMGRKGNGDKGSKPLNLNPDQTFLLLRSVAQFLDQTGFSKTLKKFLSEANIEKKDLGSTSLDLEEIFSQHFKKGDHADDDISKEKTKGTVKRHDESAAAEEVTGKKKKKTKQKRDESNEKTSVNAEASKENTDNLVFDDVEKKQVKKKKSKDLNAEEAEEKHKDGSSEIEKETGTEMVKDRKKKKKEKNKTNSESLDDDVEVGNRVTEKVGDKSKSKKRKASETESTKDENKNFEEDEVKKVSKKQKILESGQRNEQIIDNCEDDMDNTNGAQRTPEKNPGQENKNLENSGSKSGMQNPGKKQQNGSKEPKKPFQRVNVEEVVFADEKLQDNSYWSKDGAENGYGAKAQEILGQVRGRDFRHEKTKKKRGTYRGGNIDLQSHSVKFNYSDEE